MSDEASASEDAQHGRLNAQNALRDLGQDYPDTEDEEEVKLSEVNKSPTKKRKRKPANLTLTDEDGFIHVPYDEDNDLDLQRLLRDPNFDPVALITEQLDREFGDFSSFDPKTEQSCFIPQSPKGERSELLEFDPETFEVKTVLKKAKEEEEEEDTTDLELTQTVTLKKKKVVKNISTEPTPSTSSAEEFRAPKLRNRKFIFKPFKRLENGKLIHDEDGEPVEVVIPEQLAASYGLYIWPCAPVLSWYVWLHQKDFVGKKVLELGSGTSLPGLLCAKIGAEKVILSDEAVKGQVLKNIGEGVKLNGLENKVEVIGLSWGEFLPAVFRSENEKLDFLIGSDLFFDPDVFEPLCITLSYLLKANPKAKTFIAVQERSENWSVGDLFKKWNLKGRYIYPSEFLKGTDINESELTGRHTIYIVEISLDNPEKSL